MNYNKFESNSSKESSSEQENKTKFSKKLLYGITATAATLMLMTGCGDNSEKDTSDSEPKTEQSIKPEEVEKVEVLVEHGEGWDKIPEVENSEDFSILSEIANRNNEELSPQLEKLSSISPEEFLDNDITTPEERDIFYKYIENGMTNRIDALQENLKTDLSYELEMTDSTNIYDKILFRANVLRLMTAWDKTNNEVIYDSNNATKYATRIISLDIKKEVVNDQAANIGTFSGVKSLDAAEIMVENINKEYIMSENDGSIDEHVSSFNMDYYRRSESEGAEEVYLLLRSTEGRLSWPDNFLTKSIASATYDPESDFENQKDIYYKNAENNSALGYKINISNNAKNTGIYYTDTLIGISVSAMPASEEEQKASIDNEVHASSSSESKTNSSTDSKIDSEDTSSDEYWDKKISEWEAEGKFPKRLDGSDWTYSEKLADVQSYYEYHSKK